MGFDKEGFDKDGFDEDGLDEDGFDEDGFDERGFNRYGFDLYGFNKDGFDLDGVDKDGFNKRGFDKDGNSRPPKEIVLVQYPGQPKAGFTVDDNMRVTEIVPRKPADRAGVTRGMKLVAFQGKNIAEGTTWNSIKKMVMENKQPVKGFKFKE